MIPITECNFGPDFNENGVVLSPSLSLLTKRDQITTNVTDFKSGHAVNPLSLSIDSSYGALVVHSSLATLMLSPLTPLFIPF